MYRVSIMYRLDDDIADSPEELEEMIKNKEVVLERNDICGVSAVRFVPSERRDDEEVRINRRND